MDFQDMAAAIKSAADSARKTPAVRKGKNVSYTIVVKVGYEIIKKLREGGYSYDTICKIFFLKKVCSVITPDLKVLNISRRESRRIKPRGFYR